ncbi:MAG: hypothetical protein CJBNEKGG_04147 [Prosthecobacter sp.]|nr:hypothetical protein [Prosthecobacter sp.]
MSGKRDFFIVNPAVVCSILAQPAPPPAVTVHHTPSSSMKTLLTTFILLAASSLAAAAPVNSTCIMSGKPVKEGVTSEYKGKTVGFCCTNCKARFDSNPDKFGKKIAK